MTGQWEKYAEPAAKAQEQFWAPLRGHTDYPDEIDFGLARAVLATVGPLIAEDTRVRMVEAAGRAVEREAACSERAKVAEEIALAFEEGRSIPGWGIFSRQGDRMTAARMVRLYARQLDAKDAPS